MSLPIYWFLLPRSTGYASKRKSPTTETTEPAAERQSKKNRRTRFALVAAVVTLSAIIQSTITIHLLTILQAQGIKMAAAVTLGALVGPSQVLARVLEMIIGRRFHPIWTMFSSTVLVTTGLVLLSFHLPVVALGLVFFGAAMQADHDIKILKKHYLEVVTKDLRLGATADCYRLARVWQARLMARFESNVAISAGSGGRCS